MFICHKFIEKNYSYLIFKYFSKLGGEGVGKQEEKNKEKKEKKVGKSMMKPSLPDQSKDTFILATQ